MNKPSQLTDFDSRNTISRSYTECVIQKSAVIKLNCLFKKVFSISYVMKMISLQFKRIKVKMKLQKYTF